MPLSLQRVERHKGLGSVVVVGPRGSSSKRLNCQTLVPQSKASQGKHKFNERWGAGDICLPSPALTAFSAGKRLV